MRWSQGGWIGARQVLRERPDVAVVTSAVGASGSPSQSIYNCLADIEWDTPIGEIKVSHGDILMRVDVFRQVGGYSTSVLAGEDPDLCLRLRKADGSSSGLTPR